MNKTLLGAALAFSSTAAIAGPLDYNRINLSGGTLSSDTSDAFIVDFELNERLANGYFYEINANAVFVSPSNSQSLQGVWGYAFGSNGVDLALSLSGTRTWLTSGGANTVKHYQAELSLPLSSQLHFEVAYRNTWLEDLDNESYVVSLEGGRADGFQWEIKTNPSDDNALLDLYFPAGEQGKFAVGFTWMKDPVDDIYGVSMGYHLPFGGKPSRTNQGNSASTAVAAERGTTRVGENNQHAVDPVAPPYEEPAAQSNSKQITAPTPTARRKPANAKDPFANDGSAAPSDAIDHDLDFLFE